MSQTNFKVLIIGGGIGGLCLAQGLKKVNVNVEVFERDKSSTDRPQGNRIHLRHDGLSALRECLSPELLSTVFTKDQHRGPEKPGMSLLSEQISEILRMDDPEGEENKPISRITLRKILLEGLSDIVHWNKRFVRYELSDDGQTVTAFFKDGTSASGSILVAADGANSTVRSQMLPHAQRVETGLVAIASRISITDETKHLIPVPDLLKSGPAIVMGPGGRSMLLATFYPPPNLDPSFSGEDKPYIMWSVGAMAHKWSPDLKNKSVDEQIEEVKFHTKTWHPMLRELIAHADKDNLAYVTVHTSVRVEPWESGRVTFVGDAIHSMTPFRGIGGSQALRDAANLCPVLINASRNDKDLFTDIHNYEAEMLKRGFKWVDASLNSMKMMHMDGWPAFFRNWGFRALNLWSNPSRVLFGPKKAEFDH
ncbi:FAD dependent oxidoreductase [Endogone sp. FLAS-F59071]|nr:FAD dependent oxidoreductase [Endogone sp. FLAS-F59071]|eukprot:RUS20818.1 FAD dependent oxidoreductase [Endogone sp. FLAS-F59071]